MTMAEMSAACAQLLPTGKLRVGVNLANTLTVLQAPDGALGGQAIEIGKELAARIMAEVAFVPFPDASALVDGADMAAWDVAALAVDPAREKTLRFTTPFLAVDATLATRSTGAIGGLAELDVDGAAIASVTGAGYDLRLRRVVQRAAIVACDAPQAAYDLLLAGEVDAVAGVRPVLEAFAARNPVVTVSRESFARLDQAFAVPRHHAQAAQLIDTLVGAHLAAAGVASG